MKKNDLNYFLFNLQCYFSLEITEYSGIKKNILFL